MNHNLHKIRRIFTRNVTGDKIKAGGIIPRSSSGATNSLDRQARERLAIKNSIQVFDGGQLKLFGSFLEVQG